jgi:hypothetical protein
MSRNIDYFQPRMSVHPFTKGNGHRSTLITGYELEGIVDSPSQQMLFTIEDTKSPVLEARTTLTDGGKYTTLATSVEMIEAGINEVEKASEAYGKSIVHTVEVTDENFAKDFEAMGYTLAGSTMKRIFWYETESEELTEQLTTEELHDLSIKVSNGDTPITFPNGVELRPRYGSNDFNNFLASPHPQKSAQLRADFGMVRRDLRREARYQTTSTGYRSQRHLLL